MSWNGREFVTDDMVERIDTLINEEFFDWQTDLGISDGGLPPDLTLRLDKAVESLLDVFNDCITWQAENNQEVER